MSFLLYLRSKLAVIQVRIETSCRQQRLMIALLNDFPVFHNQNHIRFPNRRQTVCYDKARAPLHHGQKRLLYPQLRSRINGGCCLVQNQHWRQTKHHSCDTKKLLLPLGQIASILRKYHTPEEVVG